MRSAFFAALVLGAAAALSSASASSAWAQTDGRAFCMKGQGIMAGIGDCRFDTYEQCLATASGRRNFCDANPFYQGYAAPAKRPHRRRHHRSY